MKKIFKSLLTYLLIIAAVFLIFSLFNRGEEMFSMYNIMNGLAYGGLLIFVIFGFLSKKGNRALTASPMHLPAAYNPGFPIRINSFFSTVLWGGAVKDIMDASKKPLPPPKNPYEGMDSEDPLAVRIILALLPFVVGIGCTAVGVIYLIG